MTRKRRVELGCAVMELPEGVRIAAATTASAVNPANAPPMERISLLSAGLPEPDHLAVLTSKYWGPSGVRLTVSFLEPVPADLRDRILSHMNAWYDKGVNVKFVWTQAGGQVRITLQGSGYWSYLGPDILHVPSNQPTMSLQGFSMQTPESEYKRVVRHETGHTLGFPHEQQLPEIVGLLDPAKTIAWGRAALGWSEDMVRSQILTPIDPRSVVMTPHADVRGIMCYMLPASITRAGEAIPGGTDIDDTDAAFAARLYPGASQPPPAGSDDLRILKAGVYSWKGPL